jgi:hypothetical protein
LVFNHLTTRRNNPENHNFRSPPWKQRIMHYMLFLLLLLLLLWYKITKLSSVLSM